MLATWLSVDLLREKAITGTLDYCHISSHFSLVLYVCESSIYLYWRRKPELFVHCIIRGPTVPYIPVRYSNRNLKLKTREALACRAAAPWGRRGGAPSSSPPSTPSSSASACEPRRAALFDYWIGCVTSCLSSPPITRDPTFLLPTPLLARALEPLLPASPEASEEPFTMFDHQWNTTRYFHGFFLAAVIFLCYWCSKATSWRIHASPLAECTATQATFPCARSSVLA